MHSLYLSLGSNLGNRKKILDKAIRMLGRHVGPVVRCSSVYESKPWKFRSPHNFLNQAVCCETFLRPSQVLHRIQYIERCLGKNERHATERADGEVRYKDRPIDIDILLFDECRISTSYLTIPHPLMSERDFVIRPLNEIIF